MSELLIENVRQRRRRALVAEIVEFQRHFGDVFFDQGHGSLQIVALGTGDAHALALNGRLHLHLAFFDGFLDFFRQLAFDARAHFGDLLDLIAANFFGLADVEKTHIDAAFSQFIAQNLFDLCELEVGVAR